MILSTACFDTFWILNVHLFGLKSHSGSQSTKSAATRCAVLKWFQPVAHTTKTLKLREACSLSINKTRILVKYVTIVKDVVMLEEWKCNPFVCKVWNSCCCWRKTRHQGGRSDNVHFSCCRSSNTSTLPSHRNSLIFWEIHLLACCQNCMWRLRDVIEDCYQVHELHCYK